MKNYTESFLRAKAKNGEYRIWYSWIELRPPDVGNSEWLLRTRDAGEVIDKTELSITSLASLFCKQNQIMSSRIHIKKSVTKFIFGNMTNGVDNIVKKDCFSTVHVDI